jgi:hypothetical protein
LKLTKLILLIVCVLLLLLCSQPAWGWSNNGYSDNPATPKYGTHDWIAQHALDYLPTQEKQYITNNLQAYLYGTELPDNSQASDGIGDTTKHHVYFSATGALTDNASAQRAGIEYTLAVDFLKTQNYAEAAKTTGIMTHYIADVAVFGHVMGASTPWGTETHHSDYEDYVNTRTSSYSGSFNTYLSYDGALTTLSAYNGTVNVAYDTTFGGNNNLTCVWMDNNYNWTNPNFSSRCGQSLNLAVNSIADVLHTLYQESAPNSTPSPTPSPTPTSTPTPIPTPTPSPTPITTPTPEPSSPTVTPTVTPTPTPSPSPNPTKAPSNTPTTAPTIPPNPSSTSHPSSSPTVPEFPATQILTITMLIAMALAIAYKKTSKKLKELRFSRFDAYGFSH